jgi:hypothetical protein
MTSDTTPTDDEVTEPREVPSEDVNDSSESPDVKPAPFFSGEQVAFLLSNVAQPQASQMQPIPPVQQVPKSRGLYDSKFGWMHLFKVDSALTALIGVCLISLGAWFGNRGFDLEGNIKLDLLKVMQPVLLIVFGVLFVVHVIAKWRLSSLSTNEGYVVYAIKAFWPLLILPVRQRARLPKIDTDSFKQNLIELVFRMNSGTLTLDTAAQDDTRLHKLKGVKNIGLLYQDIA